jgi:polar amino acid transport system permease protein
MTDLILGHLPYLARGLGVALQLLAGLLAIGIGLGLALALAQVYGNRPLRTAALLFERTFRGVPAIVLLFLAYYGSTDLIRLSSFGAAVLALGLRSGAYQSQIFRGAIQSVLPGQVLAARAIGMGWWSTQRTVVLPQALRCAIGPWSNEFSSELKATSLAYVIGVVELTRQAQYIVSNTQGNLLLVFGVAAFLYFIANKIGNTVLYRLEAAMLVPGFERRGSGGDA